MAENVETKEVSSEDIERVKQLRSKYATTTAQIGQVEIELYVMKNRLDELSKIREQLFETYTNLQTEEQNLVKELNDKYGDGILDLESNRFWQALGFEKYGTWEKGKINHVGFKASNDINLWRIDLNRNLLSLFDTPSEQGLLQKDLTV